MTDTLSQKYQQKTDIQHVLERPDTYIGSIEKSDTYMWVLDSDNHIVHKSITYIPGLFKLFDECIVNCRDHIIRQSTAVKSNTPDAEPVTYIDVTIETDGTIVMVNDGNGVDVARHPEYNLWIPELIFGHLRTSTNYDEENQTIIGGKNGYGIKAVFIWSTKCTIETVDHVRKLKYTQEFNDNLNTICEPKITKLTAKKVKPYTKITFKPDYNRFCNGMTNIPPDMVQLFYKRVYDISAVTESNVKIKLNSVLSPVKTFKQYINCYFPTECDDKSIIYESPNDRWEYAVVLSPTKEFAHVSFVNGLSTYKGGKHVDYLMGQITRKLVDYIEHKKKIKVNATSIKDQIMIFIRCDIVNPSFDGQIKEYLSTPSSKFGSSCAISDKFIEKIAKMGIMNTACAITSVKETAATKRKVDGSKKSTLHGIPKLIDAEYAGTAKSNKCSLILCEGDSALSGILSGLSGDARKIYGIYPMKGKPLNVRGKPKNIVFKNAEITDIISIMGLEIGRKYKTVQDIHAKLRYKSILIMTDQDLDGVHIRGLIINFIHNEWPELINIDGFIEFMNTPILKAKHGKRERMFYNQGEYEQWKKTSEWSKNWIIKYYKGLGTSVSSEFKEYFEKKHIISMAYETNDCDLIDMVFNKNRACDRKSWLTASTGSTFIDTNVQKVSYGTFINEELIHFSKYDCARNIPNVMDGLKTSLRKILFAAFKKNLVSEIKVAQFSGYVSEHSCYHHGEASLNGAIVGMAQNFVGSNNINLLEPLGQFGTRLLGGDDSASERYIFTRQSPITRTLFNKNDDHVLKYLEDDGTQIEPLFYAPIIPMILVNGSRGVGTGFSSNICCYNPLTIVDYLTKKLDNDINGAKSIKFVPCYKGFRGVIQQQSPTTFTTHGIYQKLNATTICITELPVGTWTTKYVAFLEGLINKNDGVVKKIMCVNTDTEIKITVEFGSGMLEKCEDVEQLLQLKSSLFTSNMYAYNHLDKLVKYESESELIDDYFEVRLGLYQTRKNYLIDVLTKELRIVTNKRKYIGELLDGTIDLRRKTTVEINEMLRNKNYITINDDTFDYLTKMPMDNVTTNKIDALNKTLHDKTQELTQIQKIDIKDMWRNDLKDFVRIVV